ncbi:MAG: hypothetical protein FD138_1919 [Planctomycetota bacterium]|nr:MAG: hypothetical protein FD138_1919 [Planctomycetota bacterium]
MLIGVLSSIARIASMDRSAFLSRSDRATSETPLTRFRLRQNIPPRVRLGKERELRGICNWRCSLNLTQQRMAGHDVVPFD